MPRKRRHKQDPPGTTVDRFGVRWVMLIYFLSGLCSLIDEVVWVRLLKLTLGNTVYASCIVVSTFMGGLALGALVMGRRADRVARPLRLYAILELVATVSALLLPFALRLVEGLYGRLFVQTGASPTPLLLAQIVLSALLLLVPTFVMGSTLPILGRYVTDLEERVGRLVGRLYALNMLGATAGCFLAGFVLLRAVGVMGTLYIAAGANLVVALGGWVLSRKHDAPAPTKTRPAAPSPAGVGGRVLLLAVFASGLVSIGYELIWMRSFSFIQGAFTYVFSAVLTVYLLGNVLGAWVGSRLSRCLQEPAAGFGASLLCLGMFGILYFPWLSGWFFGVEGTVRPWFGSLLTTSGIYKAARPVFHSVALFLVPSVAMGVGFPLALQAWARVRHRVGESTGLVYGVNTIGAVLGGVVTGFALIPLLGVQRAATVLGLLATGLGVALLLATARSKAARIATAVVGMGALAAALGIPGQLFERKIIRMRGGEPVAVREGTTTTVTVTRNDDDALIMAIDNIPMAGDDLHRCAQKMLGHLAPLLHGQAESALTIGFGCGETASCLAAHGIERVDCVEIAPEVVEAGLEFFSHINLGDRLRERVNVMCLDAKNYLKFTDRRYDIIVNGANEHGTADSAPLFALEHFAAARDRLNPGGLFMTKLHLHRHPKTNFDSIVGTFCDVFPHASIWFPTTRPYIFFYLVGSREPQVFLPARIDAELGKEAVRESVAFLRFRSSADVLCCYLGDERDLRRYLDGYTPNSDFAPFVEFNLDPVHLVLEDSFLPFVEMVRRGSLADHISLEGLPELERSMWEMSQERTQRAAEQILRVHGTRDILTKLVLATDGLRIASAHPTLLEQLEKGLGRMRLALHAGELTPAKAVADMDALVGRRPDLGFAWVVKSWAHRALGQQAEAAEAAQQAVRATPPVAAARTNLAELALLAGRLDEAVEQANRALAIDPKHADAHGVLGNVAGRRGRMADAVSYFERAVALGSTDSNVLNNLAWVLATHPDAKLRDGKRSVRLAERAMRWPGIERALMLDTLAAAYAEAGRFEEAVETATEALAILKPANKQMAPDMRKRLELYKQGKPFREGR